MNFIKLNNNLKMQVPGFGVFRVTNLAKCERRVMWPGERTLEQ